MFELLVLHNRVPQNAAASNHHFVVTRDWKAQEDCFCPVMPGVSAGDAQARGGVVGRGCLRSWGLEAPGGSFSHLP